MKSIVFDYLDGISQKYSRETSTEYSYRTEFESFIKQVFESMHISAIDHDAKSKDGNKPDFAIIKNNVPILYIETKDIGISLNKVEESDQMERYYGYSNLVLTDYLEFRFYRNGKSYCEPIEIASFDAKNRTITANENNFEYLIKTLLDFTKSFKEPIKSGAHLAQIMGGKARRIRDTIRNEFDIESEKNNDVTKVFNTIKQLLVKDLSIESFSDMYAQTIVYGLFVARFNDETPEDFSRQEAIYLIPKSNPFLMNFFDHIAGPNFDERLEYIINELCEVFSHSDIEKLMNDFYKKSSNSKTTHDPVIHFYEDFLKEYDPELKKKMGAYYTPTPVAQFMVRSVDYLLKTKFDIKNGLADTEKIKGKKIHRVQVLDPAVGTGTFISAVIGEIYKTFKDQKGRWPSYVYNELLPRIHGFELMMAPYTIAHLKLGMAFKKTGFHYFVRRLGIYLTNSLDKGNQQELFTAFGLADSIAQESKEAQKIKNETPIMIVIGNPPYSGESSNAFYKEHDIYKQEPEGGRLQEKNSKWINDDYVKFFRFAESMIEKTNEGIVCMITAHGYIDNPTFRGMRWHLMKSFSSIYVLDLHGNTNKKEVSPDGSPDENVFNIKTGVSIFYGIRTQNKDKGVANVYQADLYGRQDDKFSYLEKSNFKTINWKKVMPTAPNCAWVTKDEEIRIIYEKGFSISDLFKENGVGIITARDKFVISLDENDLISNATKFKDSTTTNADQLCKEIGINNKKGWDAIKERKNLQLAGNLEKYIKDISYRLFDTRSIFYHPSLVWRIVEKIMKHLSKENVALISCRQTVGQSWHHAFVTSKIVDDSFLSNRSRERGYVYPLYLYDENGLKTSNLNLNITNKIELIVGSSNSEDIFNYVYGYLHHPNYRKKYNEFLKIDFPKIPYPNSKEQFNKLSKLGFKLRQLHLMENTSLDNLITTFPEAGSDVVEQEPQYKDGNVFINKSQYFGNIPQSAWDFSIGGYKPAQKWLKDRKGQKLDNNDLEHYQEIIVILTETEKVMKEIDNTIDL